MAEVLANERGAEPSRFGVGLRLRRRGLRRVPKWLWLALLGAATIGGLGWLAVRAGWDPRHPFMRNAPEVDRAIERIGAGDYESAHKLLADYLGTGVCEQDGKFLLSDKVRKRADGSFDLGLVLFYLGEKYGARFGDEEQPGPDGGEPAIDPQRSAHIDCALIVVQAILSDRDLPIDLRSRAAYLAGNLEFLRRKYQDAVKYYDTALGLVPGIPADARGDGIGRDAAWNRAIALRRIEAKEPKPANPQPSAQPEQKPDAGDEGDKGDKPDKDKKNDKSDDGKKGDKPDDGKKGDKPDDGDDGVKGDKPDDGDGGKADGTDGGKSSPELMAPPPESSRERPSSRMLDDLREAPTYQEENAKRDAARVRRGQAMEDK